MYICTYNKYIYIQVYPEIFILSGDTVTHRLERSRVPGSLGQLAGDAQNIGRVRLALDPGWIEAAEITGMFIIKKDKKGFLYPLVN